VKKRLQKVSSNCLITTQAGTLAFTVKNELIQVVLNNHYTTEQWKKEKWNSRLFQVLCIW